MESVADRMSLKLQVIIDGYNLLHQVFSARKLSAPGNLERARQELLARLAKHLTSDLRDRTMVIFDSSWDVETLDRDRYVHHGLKVLFSTDFETADQMIVNLLMCSSAPQQMLVVSSDREVQEAARQRGSSYINCLDWLDELEDSRHRETTVDVDDNCDDSKRSDLLTEEEKQAWLKEFGFHWGED